MTVFAGGLVGLGFAVVLVALPAYLGRYFYAGQYTLRTLLQPRGAIMPLLSSPGRAWPFAALLGASVALYSPSMGVLAGYLVYIAITDATERVIPARLSTLYAITGALALWTTGVEIHPFTALTMAILGVFSFAGTLLGQSGAGDHRMWFTLTILALPIAPPFALTAVLIGLAAAIAWWAIPRLFKHRSTIPLGTATAIGFAATALLSLAAG